MSEFRKYRCWQNLDCCVSFAIHNTAIEFHSFHQHMDFFELVFVRSGKGIHELGDEQLPIEAGNVFLVHPGQKHRYTNASGMEIYNILFAKSFLNNFTEDFQGLPNYQLLFNLDLQPGDTLSGRLMLLDSQFFPDVLKVLDDVIAEQNAREPGGRVAALSDLLRFFLILLRHLRPMPGRGDIHASHACRVSLLMAALDRRYEEPWNLDKMAALAKMASGNFRLEFKRLTGLSPIRYLLKVRLLKAKQMLEVSDLTIGEVAMKCGFNDSNYFTRQFHAQFQMTPRQLRLSNDEFKRAWGMMRYQMWLDSKIPPAP